MGQTKKNETYPRVHKDREKIFNIVQMEKNCFRIALGNVIVVEKEFRTKEEAQEHIDQKGWEMMINVFCVASRKLYQVLKQEENAKAN